MSEENDNGNGDKDNFDPKELPSMISQAVSQGLTNVIKSQREEAARRAEAQHQDDDDDDQDDDDKETDQDVDLEKLSRVDFAKHITNVVTKSVGKMLKGVEKETKSLSRQQQIEKITGEVERLRKSEDHPFFDEFMEDMRDLAKVYPDLMPEELYTLATNKNKDKFNELKKKADEENTKKAEEEGKVERPRFGGLTPTSGVTATKKDGKMTQKEASDAAWEEVMKDVPQEIVGSG